MASTPTPADPRFDGGFPPTEANDPFVAFEEALAKLIDANYAPEARVCASAPDRSAGARISPSFEATLGPAGRHGANRARHRASLRKRGVLARVTIAFCLCASAVWAWRSYGGPAPGQEAAPAAIDASAPPPEQTGSITQRPTTAENTQGAAAGERRQIDTTTDDLAALRQTVAQLTAGQEQLTRELAKLQAEKPQADQPPAEKPNEGMLRRVSAPPAPPPATPARKPAAKKPMSPQAARRPSPSVRSPPPQPALQIPPPQQLSALPLPRPPMPVPQP